MVSLNTNINNNKASVQTLLCKSDQPGMQPPVVSEEQPAFPNCPASALDSVQDDTCDDSANIPECGYDGGDCCAATVLAGVLDTTHCTTCECRDPQGVGPGPAASSSGLNSISVSIMFGFVITSAVVLQSW